jgi:predicted DNA-binding WGR domain protein
MPKLLPLEERDAKWKGRKRHFIQPKNSRYWSIEVMDATVTTSHGTVTGAKVTQSETFKGKNVGKANEIAPALDALNRAKVAILKKWREGYQEHLDLGKSDDAPFWHCIEPERAPEAIDFDNLPQSLCFYKPDNTISPPLQKKLVEGKAWYTRKRNGMAMIVAKGPTGKVQIYSRRMFKSPDKEPDKTWNDRFPHLVSEAAEMMPLNSIILGELVADDHGKDDFTFAQSLVKATTHDAIQMQIGPAPADSRTLRLAKFYIWDIAFWNGENLFQYKTAIRFQRIVNETGKTEHFLPITWYTNVHFPTPEYAVEKAKLHGWEGFVVVDPDAKYGAKGYNFKGKPDRPRSDCGKLKPRYEDDFVVEFDPDIGIGEWSTKDKFATGEKRGIKNVILYQYDKNGEKIHICELSGGMTTEMKRDLADPRLFPQVWQVSYSDRRYRSEGDDSNAMDFAAYERTRWTKKEKGDKLPHECVNPRL